MMTEEEIRLHLKNSWPVENMAAHGATDRTLEEVGTIPGEHGRWYRLYADSAGEYWYKTMIETKEGLATEYEAIFGRRKRA